MNAKPAWDGAIDEPTRALLGRRKVRPFTGTRPVIVAVDLYDLVYDGGPRPVRELMADFPASCGEHAWRALPPTVALYAAARANAVPIVHVTYDTRLETDPRGIHPTNRRRRQPDLALYTIKDSSISAIFVIFICSVWPMMINTAFGVSATRKEWLNVARTLEVRPLRKAFTIILPAAAPTILTGMRISIGIAWLVIVAAEMLVGGTGIGYFVWNEWNNLSITNVIVAILLIGLVGMALDQTLARVARAVTYPE